MLADVFKKNEKENKTSVYRFPASRGLSRRGKNEKKERKGNGSSCVIGNASEAGRGLSPFSHFCLVVRDLC